MDDHQGSAESASVRGRADDRLDSWKKIASYLKRDVSTVQRWERREGMPVHRHVHDRLGSVFAFRSELDAWWEGRRKLLAAEEGEERPRAEPPGAAVPAARGPGIRFRPRVALAALAAVLALGAVAWFAAPAGLFWRNPLADARFIRLGDFAGTQQAAAISRDGRFVAFLAATDGQTDAWLSPVGSGTYRNLTHGTVPELVNPSIRTLGFSADSSLVSVWTRHADGSQPGDVNILAMPTAGCSRTCAMPPSSTGHTTARAWCTTPPLPATRCSCGRAGRAPKRTAGCTGRRPACTATFRSGRRTMPSSTSSAACRPMTGTSGASAPRAQGSSASPRTTHAWPIRRCSMRTRCCT